ncbi:MAG: GNAT family N-acetyltransferase [Bacillota bacterium]|nr:GNAT family N-acetyltransferase [Bacillota bacterium]
MIIRGLSDQDADTIREMADDPAVQEYLPAFIADMDRGAAPDEDSILMGIYFKDPPQEMAGICELYNYSEAKAKVSIGCRLLQKSWGMGIAAAVVTMLRAYIFDHSDVRTITAHVMKENAASRRVLEKTGFVRKYTDILSDWGFDEMVLMDKYVFKREWMTLAPDDSRLTDVQVEQFVMAYGIEQDRIRAMLPDGYRSLRPVLRINTEIRDEEVVYVEFNTPVEAAGRRGWLNIDNWKSTSADVTFTRNGNTVKIEAPFLRLSYTGVGIEGGCSAEKDNEGCYYIGHDIEFRPAERIDANKEFCDCAFRWMFHKGDAHGVSAGKTIPAFDTEQVHTYDRCDLTAANAAAIPCRQVLGSYIVRFTRHREG